MKTQLIVCISIFFNIAICSGSISPSIQADSIHKLQIGEQAPDLRLNLLNYPKQEVKISEFKGKILILDFWTSGCRGCLKSWPHLMELQEEFKDKVQIVIVNVEEDADRIMKTVQRQEKIHGYQLTLPIAYNDKSLKKIFPHVFVPHVVFFDSSGTLEYITQGFNLNRVVLNKLAAGEEMNIPEKTDVFINHNSKLFVNGNVGKADSGQHIQWYTVITPYSEELQGIGYMSCFDDKTSLLYNGFSTDDGQYVTEEHQSKYPIYSTGFCQVFYGNYAAEDFFRCLYGKSGDLRLPVPKSRIEYEGVDKSRLVRKTNGITHTQNLYSFQFDAKVFIPWYDLKRRLIKDLETFFGVSTRIDKQRRTCLVLSRSDKPLNVYRDGNRWQRMGNQTLDVNNISVDELIGQLSYDFYGISLPIVDDTGYKGMLGHISINAEKPLDMNAIGEALVKYGLRFSIEEREAPILVIGKPDYSDTVSIN